MTVDGSPLPSPFQNHKNMYQTIDRTPLGDIPWSSFSLQYNGEKPMDKVPQRMDASYEICYCDPHTVIHSILGHPDFKDDMDYVPYCEYDASTGEWLWQDFMSGDWAWIQADKIAKDCTTHGSTFVPVILGSDKTVVSVATGHMEYWPLYMLIGNVRNHLCHAHKGAVTVIGSLSIPKMKKKHVSSPEFRKFKHKLFHCSIKKILQPLRAVMTVPELIRFGDNHYQQVLYSLGPYIVDYEEQVLSSCIVRGWCGKCIAFSDDLDTGGPLHSREHLKALFDTMTTNIMWDQYGVVGDVLPFTYHFPCTDIYELLALDLIHQLIKSVFKDHLIAWVELLLEKEHGTAHAQEIMDDIDKCFEQWTGNDSKVLMKVYLPAIKGHVPSDITIQRLAKLPAARVDFTARGMMNDSNPNKPIEHQPSNTPNGVDDTSVPPPPPTTRTKPLQACWHARDVSSLSNELSLPDLPQLISHFLCKQLGHSKDHEDPHHACPRYTGCIHMFNHAIMTFHTPSNPSNDNGLRDEVIWATPLWLKEMPRYDCIFVNSDHELQGMHGMEYLGITYPCALVHWFSCISDEPDETTGMWMVNPDFEDGGKPIVVVIHIDCIFHAAHLIPIFGVSFVPDHITPDNSLEYFKGFYVNCLIDHHAFDITS
ncbi:hypothetical protein EI94DRAFT_1841881 [Lactarius quietus]|nr:hypothetical protein EI94DRAFT_1841881 [Lactarius quietus]